MEYLEDFGTYADTPRSLLIDLLKSHYPQVFKKIKNNFFNEYSRTVFNVKLKSCSGSLKKNPAEDAKQRLLPIGVTPPICQALEKKQIFQPTPVQLDMIPQLLNYPEDVIALAATGTGKTAAFGVPLLQFAEEDPSPCQSLVLTPTRELALQVSKELESMAANLPVQVLPLYGGRQIQPQIKALKQNSFQIIVGSRPNPRPYKSKRLKINQLRFLV